MAFLAILAHKVPSSLSLAAILKSEGRSRRAVLALAAVFGMMVPLGALLYFAIDSVAHLPRLTAYALAFSSGTFLYIAVSDLLPHINRHGREGRLRHIGGLLAGLLVMLVLSWVVPEHAHGG
jgi:zinc and cadmium transporter